MKILFGTLLIVFVTLFFLVVYAVLAILVLPFKLLKNIVESINDWFEWMVEGVYGLLDLTKASLEKLDE